MSDLTRERLMEMVLSHIMARSDTCPANKNIARYLSSDQGMWFWSEVWRGKNFNAPGGLAAATLAGINAMALLVKSVSHLYGPADADRCMAIYLLVMISHFRDIKTGNEADILKDSDLTRAIFINAQNAGLEIDNMEGHAIELVYREASGQCFSPLWWVVSQTIAFITIMGERERT